MKLVDDARSAWKWFSMWAMGIPAAFAGAWLLIPERFQQMFLDNVSPTQVVWAVLVLLVLGMAGRLVDQK